MAATNQGVSLAGQIHRVLARLSLGHGGGVAESKAEAPWGEDAYARFY